MIEKDVLYLSMGCFWQSEYLFYDFPGVIETEVGYANPNTLNPSCGDAFRLNVTHREVVKVVFNHNEYTFKTIIKHFLEHHTVDNSPENVPFIYQSAIYYTKSNHLSQLNILLEKYQKIRQQYNKNKIISTQLIYLKHYLPAALHHQKYFLNNKEMVCKPRFNGIKYE